MTITAPTSITIDGVEHPVSGFSETVQRLVDIHTTWRNELATERLNVAKSEAAIRALDTELSQLVAKELNPEPAPEGSPDVTPVTEAPPAA